MKTTNKRTVPDEISIGVFTALYFALVTIATFGSAANIVMGTWQISLPKLVVTRAERECSQSSLIGSIIHPPLCRP